MRTYSSLPSPPAQSTELGTGRLSQRKMPRALATQAGVVGGVKRGGTGASGSAGRPRRYPADHGEPGEARAGASLSRTFHFTYHGSRSRTRKPHPSATRPGKQGPKQKALQAGFGPNSFSAAVHFQHTGIASADSKPGQRKPSLVSGRGERSSRGRAPQKSPNRARETSGNQASFPRWPRGCQNY